MTKYDISYIYYKFAGGGRPMSGLVDIVITAENIENSMVLLTADLSKVYAITFF